MMNMVPDAVFAVVLGDGVLVCRGSDEVKGE